MSRACKSGRNEKSVTRLSFCGLLVTGISVAFAQAEPAGEEADKKVATFDAAESLPIVVVVGQRASLTSAQQIKKEKIEIVDSVISEDINKLPDINVTDALSRVTGVQVLRDRGEGAGVAIRGLTQVESTLNGREIFTAGVGRVLDFADIPSEMLAGVDVYKTSSAKLLEGGIGGTIDMRTHRPFDFDGRKLSASARSIYGDLVKKSEQQVSVLASNRWQTESHGEFGALVNAAYQKRAWREDQKSAVNPVARTNIVSGQTVVAPNGTSESASVGQRERASVDMVLQWRPTSALELYAEGSYVKFKTLQDTYQINVTPSLTASFVPGSAKLFPGTNDLESITWTNAPVSILSFARDTVDETKQAALGGIWTEKATTIKADISRTESYNNLFFAGTIMGGTAANFSQNVAATATSVTGTNLLDPANLKYTGLMYRVRPYFSDLTAAKLDGEYQFDSGFLDTLAAGLRFARRNADNGSGLLNGDKKLTTPVPAGSSGYTIQNPYGDFFPGYGGIGDYLAGNADYARDAAGMYRDFATPLSISVNQLSLWRITEETQAAYLMGKFNALDRSLDGNAGLRVVRTQELVTGSQSVPTTGVIAPIDLNSSYIDYLPSANVRYLLREGLYLRGAISKTITRQNFDQLSPSLTLGAPNFVDPSQNTGSAGNPDLKPIRADNVDLAVERYINSVTSVYLTGFYKRVDGFVTNVSSPEVHDGITYTVTRPQNSNPANIRGAEVGYQQFYDFLPGWMSGLGLQANYTYVDSDTPDSKLGNVPLQNLSKRSYNIIGMYETGAVSARIAYNWRDTFLSGVGSYTGVGALPIYTKAYDWLDASVNYAISKEVTFTLEGTNLLRTVRSSYYGVETRPQSSWINDRQFIVGMTFKL